MSTRVSLNIRHTNKPSVRSWQEQIQMYIPPVHCHMGKCVCVCVCVSRQRKLPQIPTKLRVIRGARCWAGRIYEPLQTWSASYRGVNGVFYESTVNIIHHQIVGQVWSSLVSEKSPGRGNAAEVRYLSGQLGQQVGRWWDVLLPSLCKVFFFFLGQLRRLEEKLQERRHDAVTFIKPDPWRLKTLTSVGCKSAAHSLVFLRLSRWIVPVFLSSRQPEDVIWPADVSEEQVSWH